MAKNVFKRNYALSDAALPQFADSIALSVLRHIVDFNTRMVTTDTVDAYKILIRDFKNAESDEELSADVSLATDEKDDIAELLRASLRSIRNIAYNSFKGTGLFDVFGFKDISHLSDEKLIKLGYRAHRLGTKLLTKMAAEGLTTGVLDNLLTIVKNMEAAITKKEMSEEEQNLSTYYRIVKGNALNDETTRLCSIGKSLFYNVNEVSYNEFLITATS